MFANMVSLASIDLHNFIISLKNSRCSHDIELNITKYRYLFPRKESDFWFLFPAHNFPQREVKNTGKVMVRVMFCIYNGAPNLCPTTFNLSNWWLLTRQRHQGWTLTICWRCCFLRRYFQLLLAFVNPWNLILKVGLRIRFSCWSLVSFFSGRKVVHWHPWNLTARLPW